MNISLSLSLSCLVYAACVGILIDTPKLPGVCTIRWSWLVWHPAIVDQPSGGVRSQGTTRWGNYMEPEPLGSCQPVGPKKPFLWPYPIDRTVQNQNVALRARTRLRNRCPSSSPWPVGLNQHKGAGKKSMYCIFVIIRLAIWQKSIWIYIYIYI